MEVQDWGEPRTHCGWEEMTGAALSAIWQMFIPNREPEADDLKAQRGRRCSGLQEIQWGAPALPFSGWVTSGQAFYPGGGLLAHKTWWGLEEVISDIPSGFVIPKQMR